VYVVDVDQTLQRIEEHGGTVAALPCAEGSLRVATFRDPEGNLIGVWTETAVREGALGS
jgi:predicted enzyme related to lactoylglutathione lyase